MRARRKAMHKTCRTRLAGAVWGVWGGRWRIQGSPLPAAAVPLSAPLWPKCPRGNCTMEAAAREVRARKGQLSQKVGREKSTGAMWQLKGSSGAECAWSGATLTIGCMGFPEKQEARKVCASNPARFGIRAEVMDGKTSSHSLYLNGFLARKHKARTCGLQQKQQTIGTFAPTGAPPAVRAPPRRRSCSNWCACVWGQSRECAAHSHACRARCSPHGVVLLDHARANGGWYETSAAAAACC